MRKPEAPAETPAADRATVESVVMEHLADIATLCSRVFVRQADADDATHEAVLAILRAWPSYRRTGPVRHWVLKVALNAARQYRRSQSRRNRRETALPDHPLPGAPMPDSLADREEQERLRAAVAELPEDLREPVILYYLHRLTQTEIAECLGCSQKTVHMRLKRGVAALEGRLTGSTALSAMVAVGGMGEPVLVSVSPALAASVKQSISAHFAQTAVTAAATSTSGSVATGLATGGVVMNAKLATGALVLAVACALGGAAIGHHMATPPDDLVTAEEVRDLRTTIEQRDDELESLRAQLDDANRRDQTRMSELVGELSKLRGTVAERDAELAELRGASGSAETHAAAASDAPDEAERWADIRQSIAAVLEILEQLEDPNANHFELGPRMVAELGKLTDEQFAAIVEFDAEATDPEAIEQMRNVMLQALVFMPRVAPYRDEYMGRYLERLRSDAMSDGFTLGGLRRISFRMPPFVDAYAKVVAPMDDELRREYVDLATRRANTGSNDSERMDGIVFLGRTPGPEATATLSDVVRQPTNAIPLRIAAIQGLSERADADVLRLLQDTAATENDPKLVAEATRAAAAVEKRLAESE